MHSGPTPRIMAYIMDSKNYHVLHNRLYDGMSSFFWNKNVAIMI